MKKISVVFLFLFLLTSNLFAFFSSPKAFVLPFSPEEKSAPWIGIALSELVKDDIDTLDDYEIVSVDDMQNKENSAESFQKLRTLTKSNIKEFAQENDLELVVGGSYFKKGDNLVIALWILDENGIHSKKFEVFYANLVEEFSYKWYNFAHTLKEFENAKLDDFYANNPNSLIALQYYTQGLENLYAYVDTRIHAQEAVDFTNNEGKGKILQEMKAKQAAGQSMDALVLMMQQLNKNVRKATKAMDKTLDKEYIYKATHLFKEAINIDKDFGKNYTQLANAIYVASIDNPYGVPPKSYVEDLCQQAEDAKIAAECKDNVTDYKEVERHGGDDACYYAQETLNDFKEYVTEPKTSYNYSAYLDRIIERVWMKESCYTKNEIIDILDKGSIALAKHFKDRIPKNYVRYEYQIAQLYKNYNADEKAHKLYLKIMEYLQKAPTPKRKKEDKKTNTQDELIAQLQAKMQAALGQQLDQVKQKLGTYSQTDELDFNTKYKIKISQKLALYYAKKQEPTLAKEYLKYLQKYSLKDLDDIIDAMTVSKIYFYLGDYKTALDKAKEVIALRENNDMGRIGNQEKFIKLYLYMARLYGYNKEYAEAMKYAKKAAQKVANIRSFITANDNKTLLLLQKYTQDIEAVLLELSLKQQNKDGFAKLYAEVADKKAQKLYTNHAMNKMINQQLNRSLIPLLKELQTKRKALMQADLESSEKDALENEIDSLETKLLVLENMSHVIDREDALKAEVLYAKISKNSAILDFYAILNRYFMFIVHKGNIELRDIGSKQEIDKLIENKSFAKSDELYKKLFLQGVPEESKWIIIPHDKLFLLPFEALKTTGENYLIESKTVSYLPSVLMLQKGNKKENKIRSVSLFANPDYEQNIEVTKDSPLNQDRTLRGVKFTPLPGTMLEARKIEKVAQKAGIKFKLYAQKEANEKNFEKEKNSELLHIATHGYFVESAKGYNATGIVLSGANESIKKGVDNGIISAQKILDYYNYANTKLVVLSACDTGMGKLSTVDNVQSLGNAFMMVGASTVMMNLWEIPDIQTAYIMKLFYKNLFIKNMTVDEALRDAKLRMIQRGEPYEKWAALVLFGA